MEPVTHFLTGACIGRSGLNRRTAYATLATTLAAEAPDIDVLWSFGGPVVGLAHHRGFLHSLPAAPFMAAAITGLVWVMDRLLFRRRRLISNSQPIHWLWVWIAAMLAHCSHLALDWTNNYGVRPLFPFDKHWYSGDLVFIAEPVIWLLLAVALILPGLLGLSDREIGARRKPFRGRGWAIFALLGIVVLWGLRWAEHAKAANLVEAAQVTSTPFKRIAIEPYPVNPFRWHALLETSSQWQTAEVDTLRGVVSSDSSINALLKQPPNPSVTVARATRLGRVYLDWSTWPVVRDVGPEPLAGFPAPKPQSPNAWTNVQFSDLRFAYPYLDSILPGTTTVSLSHLLTNTGLTGWVYIVDGRQEAGEFLNRREQR